MRLVSLAIALVVLAGVAYVSFSTPSRAEVFANDRTTASLKVG